MISSVQWYPESGYTMGTVCVCLYNSKVLNEAVNRGINMLFLEIYKGCFFEGGSFSSPESRQCV